MNTSLEYFDKRRKKTGFFGSFQKHFPTSFHSDTENAVFATIAQIKVLKVQCLIISGCFFKNVSLKMPSR